MCTHTRPDMVIWCHFHFIFVISGPHLVSYQWFVGPICVLVVGCKELDPPKVDGPEVPQQLRQREDDTPWVCRTNTGDMWWLLWKKWKNEKGHVDFDKGRHWATNEGFEVKDNEWNIGLEQRMRIWSEKNNEWQYRVGRAYIDTILRIECALRNNWIQLA